MKLWFERIDGFVAVLSVLTGLFAGRAFAWSGYDLSKAVTLKGTVTKMPFAYEPLRLDQRNAETGDPLTITGYPPKTEATISGCIVLSWRVIGKWSGTADR
jgi:hypothetical protein